MMFILMIAFFLVAAAMSAYVIPQILAVAFRKRLFDIPDGRKDHVGAVPRLGGFSFYPVIFLCFVCYEVMMVYFDKGEWSIAASSFVRACVLFCGMTLLNLTGIADDLVGVRYRKKFVAQFLAASLFPLGGLYINNLYGLFGIHALSPWAGIPLTVLFVVFITNAINLIDGIDGLASGLCMVAFLTFGIYFSVLRNWALALLAFATLGVLVPFFYYNVFGKAERCRKIFMGDTGSLTLGYLLSFLSLSCAMCEKDAGQMPHDVVIAFSPLLVPALDVVRVVFWRFRHRRPLFQPDRNHIHHKFLAMGFSHRQSMVLILSMSVLFVAGNSIGIRYAGMTVLFVANVLAWTGLNLWFDKVRDARLSQKPGKES